MISKTFSNKWIVYKAALKRLKWLSVLYGIILFLEVPLLIWMELAKQRVLQGDNWSEFINQTYIMQMLFHPFENFVNMVVAIVFGLILFNYLQKDKASTFFHSLPIKRSALYLQNLFAGLTLMWLPIIINAVIIFGVFTAFGVTEGQWQNTVMYSSPVGMADMVVPSSVSMWYALSYWLGLSFLMTALFYIFTVFVGMFTGSVLLQGALTLIGLFLPLGIHMLTQYNLWRLLYGFPRGINDNAVQWLSPLVAYLESTNGWLYKTPTSLLWYLAVAVILSLLSIYLYKRRHAEAAGETLAAEWIRQVFKYGVAVCAALTGGLYFSSFNESSTIALYLGYLVGGILGYSISDMIAYKSFHFYKRWKGMLIFAAVFTLLVVTVNSDLYGYEDYLPAQERIAKVYLSNFNSDGFPITEGLSDQANISKVRELHQQILKHREENEALENPVNRRATESKIGYENMLRNIMSVDITYELDSGKQVKRNYTVDIAQYRELLYAIFNTEETKKSMYSRLFKTQANSIDQINISNYHFGKNVRIYKPQEIQEAITALRKDVLNVSYEAAIENKVPVRAGIEFLNKEPDKRMDLGFNLSYYKEYKNFEAFLIKYGYLQDLIMEPEEVTAILVKKAGTNLSKEITEQENIKVLLDWCNMEDKAGFINRERMTGNKDMIEYYGKLTKEDGSVIYVNFDGNPYTLQLIGGMLNNE